MIKDDRIIKELMYGDVIKQIAESNSISLTDAREIVSRMSFKEYKAVLEGQVTPPSGQTIGPTPSQPVQSQQASSAPQKVKPMWAGKGAPVQVGMTVGMQGQNGMQIPGEVAQVDANANGVKVKNPTTGKLEWMNTDTLQPVMAQDNQPQQTAQQPVSEEDDEDLRRLQELAGIRENCSAGATGAGSIAIAPTGLGKMQKRQYTNEQQPVEYTRTEAPKTIVGDTKPNQASGELSANLAARNKKTASRKNNGLRR
jgi:hypothetical protein